MKSLEPGLSRGFIEALLWNHPEPGLCALDSFVHLSSRILIGRDCCILRSLIEDSSDGQRAFCARAFQCVCFCQCVCEMYANAAFL